MHFSCLYPLLLYPLFSPSTPTGLKSTSLLHLPFPYFSHSITPFPPISISVCLPSHACLPHAWAFHSKSAIENSDMQKNLTSFSIKLSSVSHPFLFLPFYQPRLSHPQHHCWSWILCSFQANVGNLPLLLPSLPILTLFHLTWLFTHWCSDAKVMNSQQNVVCFNWRTLEIL